MTQQRGAGPRAYKSRRERRDEIVAATIAILTEHGLHAWKTAELARRVGVSEPALFRHFENKDAILTAAARHATGLLRARIDAGRPATASEDRVRGLVLTVLEAVEETGGAPIIVLAGQLSGVSPALRREIQGTLDAFRAHLLELFEARRAEGRHHAAPPSVLADLTIAVVQSCAIRWIISGRKFPMRQQAEAMLEAIDRASQPGAASRSGRG
ncbi:MAG: TetR/AcrR family transcriptional regulator [Gemmatimonadales bacterium]